jgi:subtilisin-like proprotein convertase family protein
LYPPTQLVRACVRVLLCGVWLCSWAQAGKAQGVAKAGTVRKGVGTGSTLAPQTTFTFSNSTPITINDSPDTTNVAATPYPSNITVSGFASSINTVRVRLDNLSHTFVGDIDILLVSPGGRTFILLSDAALNTQASNLTFTFDDTATDFITRVNVPITASSYKPTNYGPSSTGPDVCQDQFPSPAPTGPYLSPGGKAGETQCGTDSLTSAFGGTNPNGTWSLYVTDDGSGDAGQIAGGWDLLFDVPGVAPAVGDIVISEMRFEGPGMLTSVDDYVELQNVSNHTLDLSGLKLRIDQSGGVTDMIINPGTVLAPGQHFIAANANFYSLGAVAAPDQTYALDLSCGVQLTLADNTVLDQVGRAACTANFGEGTRLPIVAGSNTQNSYVRKLTAGTPQDTNNNAADFVLVAQNPTLMAGSVLGAPGPENRQSPIQHNATIKSALIDSGCTTTAIGPDNQAAGGTCPRNRNPVPDAANNSDFGTLTIRRSFKNNTGQTITRLRFRIVDITTQNSPGAGASQADLRARTSTNFLATCVAAGGGCPGPGPIIINGTTLDAPSGANNGGLNTSLTVSVGGGIAPGSQISVQFLLGVKQPGSYRFFINVEALP